MAKSMKSTKGPKIPTAADIRKRYAGDSSRQRFITVEGKAELCILPFEHGDEMHVWIKQRSHFVKRDKRSYICTGADCHHCRKEDPRTQYIMNVYDVKAREAGLWRAPPTAWDPIAQELGNERNSALLGGPSGHRPFILHRTKGRGGFFEYEVSVGSKLVKLPAVTALDLIEWDEGQRLRAAEESVLGTTGAGAAKTAKKAKPKAKR